LTPPQTFAALSLLFIGLIMVATGLTQSTFFRQAMIDREAAIIKDLVAAHAVSELSESDLHDYQSTPARAHFERSFSTLKHLTGAMRIKVFNHDGVIIWSDAPELIGMTIAAEKKELAATLSEQAHAAYITPEHRDFLHAERLPRVPLIEFYVPFSLSQPAATNPPASGVLSIYLYPRELNNTILNGLFLLWLVTGLSGLILFFSLYKLFRTVYFRQREAESQFAKLSADQGRILQIEKLSAMGQLVSEIAHQLNNPLVGVVNLAQLAEREADDPQRVRELLGEVRKAGDHCRGYVQRMLGFAKISHSQPRPTELKALLRETIAFFHQSAGRQHEVALAAPECDVVLEIDPVLMRHALFNLIHNAAQADPGGVVTVSIEAEAHGKISGWRLAVSDRGPGIKAEIVDKLFTPFFSTKLDGTGLGLAVAQHVALQHGGTLRAENQPGGGARFVLWLPAHRSTLW